MNPMHHMHDVGRGKRRETSSGPMKQQERLRTGPAVSNGPDEEQQRRIAARAAKAMDQQIKRRRHCRSLFVWGDKKKAVIKRYPDGTQEILVPQTLTRDEEQYQFPPRSRLLKKLASTTAEQWRTSSMCMDDPLYDPQSNPLHSHAHFPHHHSFFGIAPPTPPSAPSPRKLDSSDIHEWFFEKQHGQKNLERKQKTSGWSSRTPTTASPPRSKPIHDPSTASRAVAGRPDKYRVRLSAYEPELLKPPPEDNQKHYVPRRCLQKAKHRNPVYPSTQPTQNISKAPKMAQLVGSLHKRLQEQQQLAQGRMRQLETLMVADKHPNSKGIGDRHWSSEGVEKGSSFNQMTASSLDSRRTSSIDSTETPMYWHLLERVSRLEQSVTQEGSARQALYKVVTTAVQHMGTLQQTINEHSQKSQINSRSLQTKLDQALAEIQMLQKTESVPAPPSSSARRGKPTRNHVKPVNPSSRLAPS